MRFLKYEGKILLLVVILTLVAGCMTWRTFFRNSSQPDMRRDFLVEDISSQLGIDPVRLAKYSDVQLELIGRLDYNGLIALERYPEQSERIYAELRDFELFYDIVNEYGPQHVIPVLDYFYDEGNLSLLVEEKISDLIKALFGGKDQETALTDRQKRLLMILNEIDYQKHNFLNRFIYTGEGAKRNYVSTSTSTIVNFFTGGLSNFNAAVVTRGISHVSAEELLDAGIDILVLIPFAVYFTRSTRTALESFKGGKAATFAGRSAAKEGTAAALKSGGLTQASRGIFNTIPVRTLFKMKYVKWYVLGLVVIKPSLLNHTAALVARIFSLPSLVVKFGFWFIILFPLLNLLLPVILFSRFLYHRIRLWRSPLTAPK